MTPRVCVGIRRRMSRRAGSSVGRTEGPVNQSFFESKLAEVRNACQKTG
jgi:hypothetical protein